MPAATSVGSCESPALGRGVPGGVAAGGAKVLPLDATCASRGGCSCDCSWAASGCGKDDGSCCYACCCSSAPPSPVLPTPAPGPSPPTCQLTTGQDCVGNDLTNAPAADANACCSMCAATAGCSGFTWNAYNAQGQQQGTAQSLQQPRCGLKHPSSPNHWL